MEVGKKPYSRLVPRAAPPAPAGLGLPSELHDLEIAAPQRGKGRIEQVVVPARVVRPGDVEIRSVVGDDQAVRLHRLKDLPQRLGESGDVHTRLEPQTRAHRQRAGGVARAMRR